MTRIRVSIFTSALVALALSSASAADPDPVEILRKVDAATKAVKAVSYEARFTIEGEGAPRPVELSGTILAAEGPSPEAPRMRAKGRFTTSAFFDIVTDGKAIISINGIEKSAIRGELPAAARLKSVTPNLWMVEFLHPTPFDDELNAEKLSYEGEREIHGVACHVIHVVYGEEFGAARWFFSKEDHLPRRVERLAGEGPARVLTLSKLEVPKEIPEDSFAVRAPEGYRTTVYEPPPPRPELLPVGSEAPDWELARPDGTKVSLSSLRGKVVLMDFWATWCGPCKRAMPGVQKLSETFAGQPVEILGINCWERDGDPVAYMKEQKFSYGLLLEADEVAEEYRVSGIPTFYLIGADGRIVHRASGFGPDLEASLEKLIRKSLPKSA